MAQTMDEKRAKNREYMRGYLKRKMLEDPDKVRAEKAAWIKAKRLKDPDAARAGYKRYREESPEKVREGYNRWLAKNPQYHSEWGKARHRRTPERALWLNAKNRARALDLPFDLQMEDIVIPAVCPVLGIPLIVGANGFCETSPSIDRLIPSEGYTAANTRIISWRANTLKRDATVEELERVIAYMRRELG